MFQLTNYPRESQSGSGLQDLSQRFQQKLKTIMKLFFYLIIFTSFTLTGEEIVPLKIVSPDICTLFIRVNVGYKDLA